MHLDQSFNHPDNHRQNPPFVGGGLIPPPNTQGGNNARPGGPMGGGMMPPPSPVTNGIPKNNGQPGQGNAGKQETNNRPENSNVSRMDVSSPNPPQSNQVHNNGTAPGTPAPVPTGSNVSIPSPSQNNSRISPPTLSNNPPRPATVTGNGNNNNVSTTNPPPAPPPSAPPAPSQSTATDLQDFITDPFIGFSFLHEGELTFDETDFGSWMGPGDDVQLDFK